MTDSNNMPENQSDFLIYRTDDGRVQISARLAGESLWLSLNQMSELYLRDKSVISRHIRSILADGELVRDSVVADYATTASDSKTYKVTYYNLDMIIAVRLQNLLQFAQNGG